LKESDRTVAPSQPVPVWRPASTGFFTQLVQYIKDHLHVDLSASALATTFSIEESLLLPAFELHFGIALDQFVLRRRIERALDLLKHCNASDSEIAIGLGLGTAPAFQTVFFDYLNISPADYRRSLLRTPQAASCPPRSRISSSMTVATTAPATSVQP
jgi:AraC-like DNA-binding protein